MTPCAADEVFDALSRLYRGTWSWYTKTNWLSDEDVCDWYGLDCGSGANIVAIDLRKNHLLWGTVPSQLGVLTTITGGFQLAQNSLVSSLFHCEPLLRSPALRHSPFTSPHPCVAM